MFDVAGMSTVDVRMTGHVGQGESSGSTPANWYLRSLAEQGTHRGELQLDGHGVGRVRGGVPATSAVLAG